MSERPGTCRCPFMADFTSSSGQKAPGIRWDGLLLALMGLTVLVVPVELLLHAADSWLLIAADLGLSILLLSDLVLSGELNQNFSAGPKRSAFFVAGAAPVFTLAMMVGLKPFWIPLLQLNHLLRAPHVLHRLHQRALNGRLSNGMRIAFMALCTILFIHCLACTWMLIQPGAGDVLTRYNRALYWTVTTITTVGYGDITPDSNAGRLFAMLVMLLGVLFYGVVIGQVSRYIVASDRRKEAAAEKLDNLTAFLRHYRIPKDLQDDTYRYYRHLLAQNVTNNETKILEELPSGLRGRLTDYINIRPLAKISLFKDCPEDCLLAAAHALQPTFFDPGETIVAKGDDGENMYLIRFGQVRIHDGARTLTTLGEGQCFGEMSLIRREPRAADVTAVTMCDVFVLHKEDFDRLVARYPSLKKNADDLAGRRSGMAAS